jgi:hypothetical protein
MKIDHKTLSLVFFLFTEVCMISMTRKFTQRNEVGDPADLGIFLKNSIDKDLNELNFYSAILEKKEKRNLKSQKLRNSRKLMLDQNSPDEIFSNMGIPELGGSGGGFGDSASEFSGAGMRISQNRR